MEYYQIYLGFLALALLFIYAMKKRRDDDLKQNAEFEKIIKAVLSKKEPITEELLDFHYFEKDPLFKGNYNYNSDVMYLYAEPTISNDGITQYIVTTDINGLNYSVSHANELNDLMVFRKRLEKNQ